MALRDLNQARDLLRQNQYQLTAVSGEEKKQIITFLDGWIVPDVSYNENASRELEQLVMQEVDPVLIQIKKGRNLVQKGEEVEARERMLLEQLITLQQPRRLLGEFVGVFLIVSFFCFRSGSTSWFTKASRRRSAIGICWWLSFSVEPYW